MQKHSLRDFLTDIAIDPAQYAAYLRDPEAAMRATGLATEAQAALRSSDQTTIATRIAEEAGVEALAPGRRAVNANTHAPQCPGPLELFEPLR